MALNHSGFGIITRYSTWFIQISCHEKSLVVWKRGWNFTRFIATTLHGMELPSYTHQKFLRLAVLFFLLSSDLQDIQGVGLSGGLRYHVPLMGCTVDCGESWEIYSQLVRQIVFIQSRMVDLSFCWWFRSWIYCIYSFTGRKEITSNLFRRNSSLVGEKATFSCWKLSKHEFYSFREGSSYCAPHFKHSLIILLGC